MQIARCSCGNVEIGAFGKPITSTVCYCDACQEGSRQIESLPNAVPILDPDGGTAYVLYRKDHIKYLKGAELLKGYKTDEKSTTNRVVATCCNSAMVMRFDDAKHWVPVYRGRFWGDLPPLEWRICTKFKPANANIPNDIPSSRMYPVGLMVKLLTSKISMLLGR
ncbi:MAG: GFA family protein [Limisphaerales bacterium]